MCQVVFLNYVTTVTITTGAITTGTITTVNITIVNIATVITLGVFQKSRT